jgi:hypothetical protein
LANVWFSWNEAQKRWVNPGIQKIEFLPVRLWDDLFPEPRNQKLHTRRGTISAHVAVILR